MKLKTILKKVNRRYQYRKFLNGDAESTGMTKSECLSTFFAFTRKLKELGLERYEFDTTHYGALVYDAEESDEYSFLRLVFGNDWWESIDIYNHRGWIDEETGERVRVSWGIKNRVNDINYEFRSFLEMKLFFNKNYDKFGFKLIA